jgi:hypothetical protein
MSCPYENNPSLKQLPCNWVEHPQNPDLRVCDTCRNYYNIGKIAQKPPKFLDILPWIFIGFIIFSIISS